jgi:hypothetical protein
VHPELQQIGKSIGYSGDEVQEVQVALFHQDQQRKMIALARKTEKKNAKLITTNGPSPSQFLYQWQIPQHQKRLD